MDIIISLMNNEYINEYYQWDMDDNNTASGGGAVVYLRGKWNGIMVKFSFVPLSCIPVLFVNVYV